MNTKDGTIHHVTDTALWVAHYRAEETERPDALFRDPWAKALVGERGRKIAEFMKSSSGLTRWSVPMRTYVIDSYIEKLVAQGVDVILNLGAGLDTRPYRLHLPDSLLWIEVDYPQMIDHKEAILSEEKPQCRLEKVRLDLAQRALRRDFLSQACARGKKILVLTEGVIPYLSEAQVGELAEDLRAERNVRFWITEYFSPQTYEHLRGRLRSSQMRKAPFLFFPEDWFGFFKSSGWKPQEVKYLVEESVRIGRKVPTPWWAFFLIPFMSKAKREGFRKAMAYVLWEKIPS